MKCLSLHQPWASLFVTGKKRIETRSWRCPSSLALPVDLAVHAAKKWNDELANLCRVEPFRSGLERIGFDRPPFGAVVGVVRLIACIRTEEIQANPMHPDAHHRDAMETAFGDFSPGRFGWICSGFRPLRTPVPCRGFQGLFTLPDGVEQAMRAQLGED